MSCAHRCEMFGECADLHAAEVVLTQCKIAGLLRVVEHEIRDRFTEIAHIQDCDPSDRSARQRMYRPACDAADPARTETTFTVE